MMRRHVDEAALEAYLDGDPILYHYGHLRDCPRCRRRLADLRLLRVLLSRRGRKGAAGGHLDEEALAAFAEEALPPAEMDRLADHLAGCDHCLSSLVELRLLLDAAEGLPQAEEAAALLHGLLENWLGELRWGRHGEALWLRWRPSPLGRLLEGLAGGVVPDRAGGKRPFRGKPPPRRPAPPFSVVAERFSLPVKGPGGLGYGAGGKGSAARTIAAGPWVLTLEARPEGKGGLLQVCLQDAAGPAAGVPVVLERAGGTTLGRVTDTGGCCALPLPAGDAELRFGEAPPWRLRILPQGPGRP